MMVMSSVSPSRVLVSHQYGEDGFLPSMGEVIFVRLSQDLRGPGSELEIRTGAAADQLAVVLGASYNPSHVVFNVLPIPSYSSTNPVTHLSSTSWLINEPDHFQQLHIPVPYEEDPSRVQPHPPFPTPVRFGDPLEIGGWKNSRPSWVLAVPQAVEVKHSMTFKSFDPPIKLSMEEYRRLKEYYKHSPSLVTKVDESPTTLDSCSEEVDQSSITLDSYSEGDDDDDNWEDNMDPITFLRYYAASHPILARVVQEHDQKLREIFDQGIARWMEGVQSATS